MKAVGPPHLVLYIRGVVNADHDYTVAYEASSDGTHWQDITHMLAGDIEHARAALRRIAEQAGAAPITATAGTN